MSTLTKPVLIEPAAAAAAGCTAVCEAYVESKTREVTFSGSDDKGYRTFSNYKLEAFPTNGWTFREFVYTDTWTDTDGNTHTTERHRHPANSGTVYPTTLHTEYETDPADWTSVEPEGKHIDAQPTNTFSNVKAYFDAPGTITYTVSASSDPVNGGTVQVGLDEPGTSSSYVVTSGDSVTVVATPSSGYVFDGWYEGSTRISTSTSTTITNVTSNRSLEARFKQLVHIQVVAFKDFYVTLNGISGTGSTWTVAEGNFPLGDTITITASAPNPILNPFKAWYLNPSAWGNPEQTGTLVPGAGATYTFTATADATYFATFNASVSIEIRTEYDDHGAGEAPDAVVSINGQTSGGNKFNLQVALGSPATVGTTEYGGAIDHPLLGTCRLYFMGWIDRAADPSSSTIISTALQYAFQATQSYGYNFIASYRPFLKLTTATMPNAACGSISTSPTGRDGEWFEAWTGVTLTATPSSGYRFVKWTAWESLPGGQYEYDISTNAQISIEVQDYDGKTIRAYFEWDGTDLLVDSANLGSPVQLVYDPATNLLVADY